ncbi:unnamed protein product [Callosobruchus maculatus]|uniref:MARVEL domain-containing protein n=1 Tax=Callosobruchus maculatus TaxID=64391 RepID=A0A653C0F8_CALMS|nr:unnamed protein product [Callosobruchus maculatus]
MCLDALLSPVGICKIPEIILCFIIVICTARSPDKWILDIQFSVGVQGLVVSLFLCNFLVMSRGARRGSKTNKTQWPVLVFVAVMCLTAGVLTCMSFRHFKLLFAGICSNVACLVFAIDACLCFAWSR